MSEHIYKQVELTGTSKTSVEDAVQNAIAKASQTLRNIHWFQVVETRGYIENNTIDYWQVTIKLGFRLEDSYWWEPPLALPIDPGGSGLYRRCNERWHR